MGYSRNDRQTLATKYSVSQVRCLIQSFGGTGVSPVILDRQDACPTNPARAKELNLGKEALAYRRDADATGSSFPRTRESMLGLLRARFR
jgi:hypothetical protein